MGVKLGIIWFGESPMFGWQFVYLWGPEGMTYELVQAPE